ncbi:hypothetical protein [Phenylobacterium sp.]|uniref:hypothetical protein n=1 Tax=Phenylobacterium sp. TaxID=1871053 RepID=UPI0025DA82EA|nr:hypothetical protein [Phenylobacterium sp.]
MLIGFGCAPDRAPAAREAAKNIMEETGGELDLLILASRADRQAGGFAAASRQLKGLKVREIWTGWPLSPFDRDPEVETLSRQWKTAAKARDRREREDPLAIRADDLGTSDPWGPFDASSDPSLAMIFNDVGPARTRWLQPGETVRMSAGFQAEVLAPPRASQRLFRAKPRADERLEADGGWTPLDLAENLVAAAGGGEAIPGSGGGALFPRSATDSPSGDPVIPGSGGGAVILAPPASRPAPAAPAPADLLTEPFSPAYHGLDQATVAAATARLSPLPKGVDPAAAWLNERYLQTDTWRKIDYEWLQVGSTIGLQMDAASDNASLVVALELSRLIGSQSACRLLFTADARAGSWLSWADQTYAMGDLAQLLPSVQLVTLGALHNDDAEIVLSRLRMAQLQGLVVVATAQLPPRLAQGLAVGGALVIEAARAKGADAPWVDVALHPDDVEVQAP